MEEVRTYIDVKGPGRSHDGLGQAVGPELERPAEHRGKNKASSGAVHRVRLRQCGDDHGNFLK